MFQSGRRRTALGEAGGGTDTDWRLQTADWLQTIAVRLEGTSGERRRARQTCRRRGSSLPEWSLPVCVSVIVLAA